MRVPLRLALTDFPDDEESNTLCYEVWNVLRGMECMELCMGVECPFPQCMGHCLLVRLRHVRGF